MTEIEIAAFSLAGSALATLVGFVWTAAVRLTRLTMRVDQIEKDGNKLSAAVDRLVEAVNKLDKRLAVSNARASQGQFDQGDTIPPSR